MGDLFIVAVRHKKPQLQINEANEMHKDVILRLDHGTSKLYMFYPNSKSEWISDLTNLYNNDLLIW